MDPSGCHLKSSLESVLLDFSVDESEIGSYKLEIHSPDSDIDLVCVAPERYQRLNFQRDFFFKLQVLPEVTYCNGIYTAKVPIIKVIINNIKVDLQYANTDQELDNFDINLLDEPSLLALNAYLSNEILLSLLPSKDKFRVLFKVVRLWAKNRGIYSGVLGFLSGAAWSILCAKICIVYPELSDIELIQQFYDFYSEWNWTVQISLVPNANILNFQAHSPNMMILTPAFPSINAAHSLSASAYYIIIKELKLASSTVKEIIEGNLEWENLFEEIVICQEFRYIIKVNIETQTFFEYETWQGIVLSKVKTFLSELESLLPGGVVFMHDKPYEISHEALHEFKVGFSYFIGVNTCFVQNMQEEIRGPIKNFCDAVNELRPNKNSMSIRVGLVPNKKYLKS